MRNKIITVCMLLILIFYIIILAVNVNENKDNKFNIVTSFYPMYIATLNITEGVQDVSVTNLTTNQGGCIHDYVLTTTELVTLAKADVFVINGAGMESFMDKVIANFDELEIIDSSVGIDIIHEECETIEKEHDEHDHETNSHIFVNVKNYIKQVQNICDKLIKIDSKNKDIYESNSKIYIEKLKNLDSEIEMALSELENRNIVTFHNSFEYFAKEYGLNIIGTVENEHGKSLSASFMTELVNDIKSNNVRGIFAESDYNIKIVDALAKETGTKVYLLNPITSGKDNKDEYINIMKENLSVLKEALK